MPRLEWSGGPNPHRDIASFLNKAKAEYTGISDMGLRQLVKRITGNIEARIPMRVVAVFGEDILTENPENIRAWMWLEQEQRDRILAHPVNSGERVGEGDARVSRLEMANRLDHAAVHRSAIVSIPGLEQTYVWRLANRWTQEVSQKDYDLLTTHPEMKRKLQDPDRFGPVKDVRAFDAPVVASYTARNPGDVRALQRQFSSVPQYAGVDLKKG